MKKVNVALGILISSIFSLRTLAESKVVYSITKPEPVVVEIEFSSEKLFEIPQINEAVIVNPSVSVSDPNIYGSELYWPVITHQPKSSRASFFADFFCKEFGYIYAKRVEGLELVKKDQALVAMHHASSLEKAQLEFNYSRHKELFWEQIHETIGSSVYRKIVCRMN